MRLFLATTAFWFQPNFGNDSLTSFSISFCLESYNLLLIVKKAANGSLFIKSSMTTYVSRDGDIITSLTHHQFGSLLREFQRSSSLYVNPSFLTSTGMDYSHQQIVQVSPTGLNDGYR